MENVNYTMTYDPAINDYLCDTGTPVFGVDKVAPSEDYQLRLRFNNGESRVFDARQLFNKPIFTPLKDKRLFLKAHTDGVAVIWNDDIDIAPEYLYENSEPA